MSPEGPGPGAHRTDDGPDAAMPGATVLSAPAKLTLSLKVTGVRPDGYHLLDAEMVTVGLADRLLVGTGTGLTISTEFGTGGSRSALSTGPDNLVMQALASVDRSARVHLVKRIPPGAGLGGGSADAAAILRWSGCSDLSVAARLGADVPFCVNGGRARVGGIGEVLAPQPFEPRSFVLFLLPFGVDTGAVYRAWDRLHGHGVQVSDTVPPGGSVPAVGQRRPGDSSSNDLEAPALVVEPRLAAWRSYLGELTGRDPRLAGSGSTWFVEGAPDEFGLVGTTTLVRGEETALVVPVRTTPGPG